MFKEFIISIVIVIGIIVGNNITQNYTVETVEVITKDLVEIKEEIENEKENIELEQVKGKLEKIEEDWKERHDKLAYYIEHNELEKVETNLKGLKSYLETDEYSEAMSELDKCIFVLEHIQRKNEFNLQNIF